jgi:hypothetical protein
MGLVEDMQAFLDDAGLAGDSVSGWPSVRRRLHDESDQLVVITEDGGTAPEIPAAAGLGSAALKDPAVQVRVRAAPWDGDASLAKAQAIMDALHGQLEVDMGEGHYLRVVAQSAAPVFIGYDERSRPEHTISFRAAAMAAA